MGWVAGPRLVAATAEAGGLGILASATMTFDELVTAIAEVRARTDQPFGVNMRTDVADVGDRVALMIDNGVRVASFAQAPNPALVARCREAGLVVMPTIGARRHAEKVAEWGVDAVIAQGGEGGGHTGTVPTSLLLPAVVDAVGDRVAVVAAGGYFDGRGLVAALAYGASAHRHGHPLPPHPGEPGTRRGQAGLPADAGDRHRGVDRRRRRPATGDPDRPGRPPREVGLAAGPAPGTVQRPRLPQGDRHHPARPGSRKGNAMRKGNDLSWPQVVMAANAPMMTKAALVDGRTDVGVLPTGQVVGEIGELPTVEELISRIMDEAGRVLDRLGA